MHLDLSTQVAAWLGITIEQLGAYGIALAALCSWLLLARPRVRAALASSGAWCEAKRKAAALTVTPVDDYAASFAAGVVWCVSGLFELVLLIAAALAELTRAIPAAMERARAAKAASTLSSDDGPPTRPLRKVPRGPLGMLTLCILLAGALVTTSGCAAGAPAIHQGLNAVTDLVDPGYQAAVIECDLQEGEIIASYPPEDADAADVALAALRVRCDVAFASFQGVRAAQLLVRAALDAKEDGRATVQDVLRSLDELREAVTTSRQFVDAIRAVRRGAP
jgi:hypothetical protein